MNNQNIIRIVAKSANTEERINDILKDVCGRFTQYRYWYGAGLWNINIYAQEMEESDLRKIESSLMHGPTDSCMIFLDEKEMLDNSYFTEYNSLEHQLLSAQPMTGPTGKIFKLNIKE